MRFHLANFIQFPSDEEEQGHVAMAWCLPYRLIDGIKTMQGIKLLASYLTFTQVREISQRGSRNLLPNNTYPFLCRSAP